jgi:hypothetical protein
MKTTALAVLALAPPSMALAQSATFEVHGLPVSLHQAQVIDLPDLQEQAAAPVAFWRDGFAASPVQLLVLGARDAAQHEDTVAREELVHTSLRPVSASGR